MRNRGRKGMSLIEIMVGLAILSAVVLAVYMMILRSSRAYTDGSKLGTVAENARKVLDDMSKELRLGRGGASSTVIINPSYNGAQAIQFYPCTGATSGTPTYDTTLTTFRLESSPLDANGNKSFSDDWKLVRARTTPGNVTTVTALCDYVKPGGLTFTKSGDNVVITLTLHVVDDKQVLYERALSTSVTLRNK